MKMSNHSPIITTSPVLYSHFSRLIELDRKVMSEETSMPANQAPPVLTYAELDKSLSSGDCIEWLYYGKELAGYYWFERKPDHLYIAGIVIRKPFQGLGLSRHVLTIADKKAQEWQLSPCRLTVSPLNGPALSAYFKHQYRIIQSVPSFFGPTHPNLFRFIMEKNPHAPQEILNEELQILCSDFTTLKKVTDEKYSGIGLIRSEKGRNDQTKIIFQK